MPDTFRGLMTDFSGPSALDLLTEFRKKHIALAERRSAELRAAIEVAIDADRDRMLREGRDGYGHAPHIREMIDEYESLRYFEQELNRLIGAFVNEATRPWREAYASTLRFDMLPESVRKECGPHSAASKTEEGL